MSITQRILKSVALPDESLPSEPVVELFGHKRVLIENHDGVTQYGTECIQVQVKYGWIYICGTNLRLCRMMGRQLIITGNIDEIQLRKGCVK